MGLESIHRRSPTGTKSGDQVFAFHNFRDMFFLKDNDPESLAPCRYSCRNSPCVLTTPNSVKSASRHYGDSPFRRLSGRRASRPTRSAERHYSTSPHTEGSSEATRLL